LRKNRREIEETTEKKILAKILSKFEEKNWRKNREILERKFLLSKFNVNLYSQ